MGAKAQYQTQPVTDGSGGDDGERLQEVATRTLINRYIGKRKGLPDKELWNVPAAISLFPALAMRQHFASHGFPPSRQRQNGITRHIAKWLA